MITEGIYDWHHTCMNWTCYTDGGSRNEGRSAFSWVIYASVHLDGKWLRYTAAYGVTGLRGNYT